MVCDLCGEPITGKVYRFTVRGGIAVPLWMIGEKVTSHAKCAVRLRDTFNPDVAHKDSEKLQLVAIIRANMAERLGVVDDA